ncbi:L-arabinose transporter permease [Caballeronia telluris]|jgi:simple sugar transport system permease protein/ribose transport system permease protein|uniref:L-arabinose transporter permease n=1 Tax=Caballeronia telluris TaxID=326475 RepID=A0A158K0N4_9BURK|nr:L-arabinose transporter permease [Caballeronia telluris]
MKGQTLAAKRPDETVAHAQRSIDFSQLASRWGTVAAAVIIFIAFALGTDRFVSLDNISNVLVQISVLMVISSGLTVAVASGEFDLSIGQAASLAGVLVAGMLVLAHQSVPVAIAVALLSGVAIGLINGLLVTVLRIPSLIATLAMGPIALGVNYAYTGGDSIYATMPDSFYAIAKGTVFGVVPMPIVIALVTVFVFYVLLNRTRLGRSVIATGANIQAARLSGIKVNRARVTALVLSAAGAALGGVMLTARLGTGQSGAGDAYLMDSLTAVFLGMTAFKPGRATIQGTLVGVVIIGMLDNGLNLIGAPFYLQNIVRGVVMVAAVGLAVLRGEIRFFR